MSWDEQQYPPSNEYQYDMYNTGYSNEKTDTMNTQQYYNPNDFNNQPQMQNSFNGAGYSQAEVGGQGQQYYGAPTPYGGGYPGGGGPAMYTGQQNPAPSAGQQFMMPGATMLQDPMVTNFAVSYGKDFAAKGQQEITGFLDKYVSISQLKYYFAVDTSYVTKKLSLLVFPFIHKDWSIRFSHGEYVQPRFELNAADLYIPSMAFVTYIIVVGYMLGLQEKFSPEKLATTASSALTALFLEIIVVYLTTTVMSISSTLAKWDFLAFSMYKYVSMILCLLAGLLLASTGYYASLLYTTIALALFLFRTLHLRIEPEVHGGENHGKRKLWLISLMVVLQPLIMWWLTYSLIPSQSAIARATTDF